VAYIDPDTNNVLALRDGAILPFPAVTDGASSTVTLLVSNSSGTAQVESVVLNSAPTAAFQLINLPALPASVTPSQQVRFGVRFSPQPSQQVFSATLLISINGKVTTVNLQAQSIGPQFTYSYGAGSAPVTPGGTLALGDTAVGQSLSVTVFVTNTGNTSGQI